MCCPNTVTVESIVTPPPDSDLDNEQIRALLASPLHTLVHAYFSAALTLRVHFAHFACYTMQGSRVSAVLMSSSLCHFTFSFLMLHPSLLSLFLDGHFETTPDCDRGDLTDFHVHDFLQNFPDLKAQVKRTPHEDELFGYLAKSALNTTTVPTGARRKCKTITSLSLCTRKLDVQFIS